MGVSCRMSHPTLALRPATQQRDDIRCVTVTRLSSVPGDCFLEKQLGMKPALLPQLNPAHFHVSTLEANPLLIEGENPMRRYMAPLKDTSTLDHEKFRCHRQLRRAMHEGILEPGLISRIQAVIANPTQLTLLDVIGDLAMLPPERCASGIEMALLDLQEFLYEE